MENTSPLTPEEAADLLRITKNTVYQLIKRGELPATRVGKKLRLDAQKVRAYLQGHNGAAAAPAQAPSQPLEAGYINPGYSNSAGAPYILCGQDPLLDLLVRRASEQAPELNFLRSYQGSYNGLFALYQGQVQAATAHLWDPLTNTYNTPFLPHILPGIALYGVHLVRRQVGFYTAPGNPLGLRAWEDLARSGLRFCNRERGSGIRVLVDGQLQRLGLTTRSLSGYSTVANNHLRAAAQVAQGEADAAVGIEAAARQVRGVDFVPLQEEQYDLILPKDSLDTPSVRVLLQALNSPHFRQDLEMLGGYQTQGLGEPFL